MAENSRKARREADKYSRLLYKTYLRRFISFAHNKVKFEGLGDTPKRYFLKVLINDGAIAYDKETRLFLSFVPIGYDVYGLPTEYTLYGYNGYTLNRKADEVVILRVNDIQEPIKPYLQLQAKKVVKFDMAIEQNLEAIKTMTIYECEDDGQALSMVNEADNRRIGSTIFFRKRTAFSGTELKCSSTGATYLIDKLQEARQKILNDTYASLGTATANTDKRERVQGKEIDTSLAYATDCLYIDIDTFNYDAEQGGLNLRMVANTSLKDIEVDNEENIKKDEKVDKIDN